MSKVTGWLNENANRAYPLKENTQGILRSGPVSVPFDNDVILDLRCTTTLAPASLSLKTVSVTSGVLGFVFSYGEAPYSVEASILVPSNTNWPYRTSLHGAVTLSAVFGRGVEALAALDEGEYLAEGLVFEPTVVCTAYRRGLDTVSGNSFTSVALEDDVFLEEGYGVRIYMQPDTNSILLTGIPGGGAGFSCLPLDEQDMVEGLRLVNGMPPDANNNLAFRGGKHIAVEPDEDNHELVIRTRKDIYDIACEDS